MLNYRMMELTTLNEIAKVVNSTLELSNVLDEIVRLTTARMRADGCAVFILENQELILQAARGLNMRMVDQLRIPLGKGVTGSAAKVGKPIVVKNIEASEEFEAHPDFGDYEFVSMLAVPLISRGTILGVINIYTKASREFGPQEMHFLSSIANMVAGAIRNGRIYERATRMIDELKAFQDISALLNESLEMSRILTVTVNSSAYLTNSGGAFVRLKNQENYSGNIPSVVAFQHTEGHIRPVHLEEKEARATEITLKQGYPHKEIWECTSGLNIRCHLFCVPLEIQGEIQGTVAVYRSGPREVPYTSDERRLLGTFLSQAATSIENARLFEVTNRQKMEIKEAQDQLVQKEKLAALGGMSAGVAHELRNPLTSIGGYAKRISKLAGDSEKLQNYANIIVREVKRLESLLDDILAYVNPRKPDLDSVDLESLFNEVYQTQVDLLNTAGDVDFVREVSSDASHVWADKKHLETALIDLVKNSIESLDGSGTVTMKSEPDPDDPDKVRILIKDTGQGITPDDLQRIFEPFFTTKSTGSGLGLATTKNVIEAHEGKIDIESELGLGTTFRIVLRKPPRKQKQRDLTNEGATGEEI